MKAPSFSTWHFNWLARALVVSTLWMASRLAGQFSPPESWPRSIDKSKVVHYVAVSGDFAPPGDSWVMDELQLLSGGDQETQPVTIGGFAGLKVVGNYLNTADKSFGTWAEEENIDILMQVYGDAALYASSGGPRDFQFLTGTLPFDPPYLAFPVGGQIPVEAKNRKWNWVLFRVTNGIRADGNRFVGTVGEAAQGATAFGGVNGGTIRLEGVPALIVRLVAFGQRGAFGEPEVVNQFATGDTCDPEPNTNLAGIDFAAGTSNRVQVLNNGDQLTEIVEGIGPAGDKRRAARPLGTFINFAVKDNYLGKGCNDPRVVKVCVDYYDDPALAGATFGPEAFATDDKGGVGFVDKARWAKLSGTGKWLRRSWSVSGVNLFGVNTAPLTGGPRFGFEGGSVAISRFEIAVLRIGTHPMAGIDPLAACIEDPNVCNYGTFAELDLARDIRAGIDVGNSSGDQEMKVEEAGPANDRRLAVRAALDDGTRGSPHQYINFKITDEVFGPTSQPNAHMAICVTYYDDPELTGKRFKPEVYRSVRNGVENFAFTPDSYFVALEGSGKWRDAYWELPDVKLSGVNEGPQAAARFVASDKIFVSRVRYAVIRPCGDKAGVNELAACKPLVDVVLSVARGANNRIVLSWPTAEGFGLESADSLTNPNWLGSPLVPTQEGGRSTVTIENSKTQFFRLRKP